MTVAQANELVQTVLLLVLLGIRLWPIIVRLVHRFQVRWPLRFRPESEVVEIVEVTEIVEAAEAVADVGDRATAMAGLVADEAKRRLWLIRSGDDDVA